MLDCSLDLCLPFKWLVFERSRCEMDGVESPSLDFLWEVQNVETEGDAGVDPPVPGVAVAEDAGNGPHGGERIYMPGVVTNSGTVESVGEGDSSKMVVPMPFGVLACPCRQAFCSVYEFELHMDRAHVDVDLRYRCDICAKTCFRAHGAKIHRSKCRGQKTISRTDLPWGCNVCAMAFRTKSGLSQHKRHRHPAIRNLERKADCKSVVEGEVTELTVKPTKLWSLDEVERLRELEVKHQGKRSINLLIAAELVGKSNKQVSEKRRALFGSRAKVVGKKSVSVPAKRKTEECLARSVERVPEQAFWQFVENSKNSIEGLRHKEALQTLVDLLQDGDVVRSMSGVSQLLADITPVTKPQLRKGGKSKKKVSLKVRRRSKTKAEQYRHQQQLFTSNKKKLLAEILEGVENSRCPLSVESVEETFRSRFEEGSSKVDMSHFPRPLNSMDCGNILKPFVPSDVMKVYSKTRRDTASGPDGICLKAIQRWDPRGVKLAAVFNIFLMSGKVPESLKSNRSILLHKGGETDEIGNWRPLTIGCMVLRLYTKILAERFQEATPINPCQRGFVRGGGCDDNIHLVEGLVRDAKKRGKPISVCFLDLAKAFDTISHDHVIAGLVRFGASEHVTRIVQDLYQFSKTRFTIPDGTTGEITINRGVKQGDPLSPVLFNIAMDPLFCLVEKSGVPYRLEDGTAVSVAGYADDTLVVSGNRDDLQVNVDLVSEFCRAAKLKLNARKSYAYTIRPVAKTFLVNCGDQLRISSEVVSWIEPGVPAKYLGARMDPWVRSVRDDPNEDLRSWCVKIGKAALKGRQKFILLTQHLLPRLRHRLAYGNPGKVALCELDVTTRLYCRRWLHLPECVSSAFLHTRQGDGGVGLPCFEKEVPMNRVKSLYRMLSSKDSRLLSIAHAIGMGEVLEDHCRRWAIDYPIVSVSKLVRGVKRSMRSEWESLGSQGPKGTFWKSCSASNGWMSREVLSEREHTVALQLRSNTYPTREAICRGRPGSNVACRRCGLSVETLGHISGRCMAVKRSRIKRHNKICGILVSSTHGSKWEVMIEPHIKSEGKTYIPDLVFLRGSEAVVVDPTVVWESKVTSLSHAASVKVAKYLPIVDALKELTGCSSVSVYGFPIGARGTWYKGNNRVLDVLGVHRSKAKFFCLTALCDTIKLLRVFTDR